MNCIIYNNILLHAKVAYRKQFSSTFMNSEPCQSYQEGQQGGMMRSNFKKVKLNSFI